MAASQQRGVAGEAASRHDADERHLPAQRAEQREGLGVEPGDDGHVGVARTPAAALGEEHDGEAQPLDELEEAVLLAVVHLALGAGQDGIVVRQHGATRPFIVEEVAVDPPDAGHEAVGRRVGDEVLGAPARPLGRDDEAAVLLEAARGRTGPRCSPGPCAARRRAGARWPPDDPSSRVAATRARSSSSSGRTTSAGRASRPPRPPPSPSDGRVVLVDPHEHVPGLHGVADGHRDGRHGPGRRRLDDVLHLHGLEHEQDGSRPATWSPGRDVHAEHGAGEGHRELGQPSHRGAGTSKPTSVPQVLR